MALCEKHDKPKNKECLWCGKKVCEDCLETTRENKKYCYDCYESVFGSIKRVEKVHHKQKPVSKYIDELKESPRRKEEHKKNKNNLEYSKSGYFDFTQLQNKK